MACIYEYSQEDFIYETNWNDDSKSNFNETVITKWTALHHQGDCFKYKLNIKDAKILPGKYQYLSQLNLDRVLLRRKPIEVQSLKMEFDPTTFNFTKMDKKEILFEIVNKDRKNKGNYLAINVSPLEFGHCLYLPALYDSLPQVVTTDSLRTAIELFLLSNLPALRMGFNGLCAFASLNHLHFHTYYLQHPMLLETIELEHLVGPCYTLVSFPSRGFAFLFTRGQNLMEFVRDVFKLVSYLQENEKPHNIYITRGSGFREKSPGTVRNYVRVYVWARKPMYGIKDMTAFHPALCELFGHLLLRKTEDYETLTEASVAEIMSDQTTEPFESVVERVRQMFQEL